MMFFHLLTLPLEYTIFKLNISYLQLTIILIDSFKVLLFITKEMIDSIHTGFCVNKTNNDHNKQTHRGRNKVKNREDCVYFRWSEAVLAVDGWIHTKYDNGSENGEHAHNDFDVSSIYEGFESKLYLFSSNCFYLICYKFLPSVIFNDPNSWKVLVNTLSSFVSPKKLVFPQLKPFLGNNVLEVHADSKNDWGYKANPPYLQH